MVVPNRSLRVISAYRELVIVVAAAAVGLTVQPPLQWVVRHQGIDVFLVILVFFTALAIEPRTLRRLPAAWRRLSVALLAGISILPALSWLVAHLVVAGSLRDGVMTIGLAPCEIASIATTAMASGDIVLAGGILLGSTLFTVGLAGPVLAAESSGRTIDSVHVLVNLLCIVALPLGAGIALRSQRQMPAPAIKFASGAGTLSLAVLVALVAAEVHFSRSYLAVEAAIIVFLVATAGVGLLLGMGSERPAGHALLLTSSMRDFAIAAGLATAAFGPTAAASLGLYGITVLLWGTGAAGFLRARNAV
jgi:predicted Na+-dependent transporter